MGVDESTAGGHHFLEGMLIESDRLFLPVNEVGAFKVPPVQVAPENAEGIVLVVEMVFPVLKNHAVGIVVPSAARGGMELIAVGLGVVGRRKRLVGRANLDAVKCRTAGFGDGFAINRCDLDLFSLQPEMLQWIRREPEGVTTLRKGDIEALNQRVAVVNA